MKQFWLIALAITLMLGSSCKKLETYPEIPQVSFKSFSMSKTSDILGNEVDRAILSIHVIDGDGDIGLQESDTIGVFSIDSVFYNDLFIELYEKIDGKYVKKPLIVPHNYRVPYVEPQGQIKTIKADIQVQMDYTKGTFDSDTIMYRFWLVDRKLHVSDTVSSPDLSISYYLSQSGFSAN